MPAAAVNKDVFGRGANATLVVRCGGSQTKPCATHPATQVVCPPPLLGSHIVRQDMDNNNNYVNNYGGGLWKYGQWDPNIVVDDDDNVKEDDGNILSGISIIFSIVPSSRCCCCCPCCRWSSQSPLPPLPLPPSLRMPSSEIDSKVILMGHEIVKLL